MKSSQIKSLSSRPEEINWKLYSKSGAGKNAQADKRVSGEPTIKEIPPDELRKNTDLLWQWSQWYDSLQTFRDRRKRVRDYLRGKQWGDRVQHPDNPGVFITEEKSIALQGKIPLKQNIMSQIKNNIIGRFRGNQLKPMVIARDKSESEHSEMLANALQHAYSVNDCKELDASNFMEFIMSGMPICKVGYKYWKERNTEDAWVQNINPNRFFFNTDIGDVRHSDLRVVGEIHDLTRDELISVFAKNTADKEIIERWYAGYGKDVNMMISSRGLSSDSLDNVNFFVPSDTNKCRVIEGWYLRSSWRTYVHDYLTGEYYITDLSLKAIQLENQERVRYAVAAGVDPQSVPLKVAEHKYEQYWYVKFLTPFGQCLYEGETGYKHESHPYVFVTYPLIDGEVFGMFDEIIDQQRYINRLVTMMDFMIGASAKGVLLVPEESIPDDMNIDDFADEWSRYNGVIKIKAKPGQPLPQQVVSRGTSVGVGELLQLQLKLMQEISGVNYAIQGQRAGSSTPSSLYAQEAENSAINSKDVMETYTYYLKKRDQKLLKVIHQYYNEKRMLSIAGDSFSKAVKEYDPEKVADLDFDVEVAQTIDTPVFRQVTDDILLRMLEGQLIDIESYLENSSMPFAKSLLDSIIRKREAMMQHQQGMMQQQQGQMPPEGDIPQGALPEQLQQQPNVDPRVMNMVERMMQRQQSV